MGTQESQVRTEAVARRQLMGPEVDKGIERMGRCKRYLGGRLCSEGSGYNTNSSTIPLSTKDAHG